MSQLKDDLSHAIQSNIPFGGDDVVENEEEDEVPESGVLTGWLVVCEWLGADDERWLSHVSGDASNKSLPRWQIKGYAQEMLDWD